MTLRRTHKEIRENRLKELAPAPGELALVQAFLNTANFEAQADALASPESASAWMAEQGWMPAGAPMSAVDAERVRAFRENLRQWVEVGEAASEALRAALDDATHRVHLRARFDAGKLSFTPVARGLDGAQGRVLAAISAAQRDGHWALFKICRSETCRAAFYDNSTNHSGLWCAARCGTRLRVRAHRRRFPSRRGIYR